MRRRKSHNENILNYLLAKGRRTPFSINASYLILSLMEEEPVLNSFHIEGTQAEKENLVIV